MTAELRDADAACSAASRRGWACQMLIGCGVSVAVIAAGGVSNMTGYT